MDPIDSAIASEHDRQHQAWQAVNFCTGIDLTRALEAGVTLGEVVEMLRTFLENGGLYETEYDGRMYELCQHCDYQDNARPWHNDKCPILKAEALLSLFQGAGNE